MSYEQKYLKYKQKYLELKNQLEMNGGGDTTTNNISVNTDTVLNLSETPVGQTGGFFGLFKSNNEPSQESVLESVQEPSANTELNLTETPSIDNKPSNNEAQESNQKIYTEINLGPESNMKNVVLSDTPTNEQSGGFFGSLGSAPVSAPNNVPCAGTVNTVSPDIITSQPIAIAAAETAASQAAAAQAVAAQAAEAAAAQAAAQAAEAAAAQAAQAAAAQAAPVAQVDPVAQAVPAAPGTSKYSVGNSEVNNTEDIEKLFSQLGGNYLSDLVDESSSSIFSTESDLSITLSEDDLLEKL